MKIAVKEIVTFILMLNVTIVAGQTSEFVQKQDSTNTVNLNNNENQHIVSLSLGVIFSHFNTAYYTEGYIYSSLVNIGAETLVNYKLLNNWSLSTGVNYQFGKLIYDGWPAEKITFGELTAPVLSTFYLFNKTINVTTGIYFGKYTHLSEKSRHSKIGSNPEFRGDITKYMEEYSEDRYISDFYFSVGYNTIKKSKGYFQFNLFARYRLNEMWFNKHISKFVFGAKINYLINLKL